MAKYWTNNLAIWSPCQRSTFSFHPCTIFMEQRMRKRKPSNDLISWTPFWTKNCFSKTQHRFSNLALQKKAGMFRVRFRVILFRYKLWFWPRLNVLFIPIKKIMEIKKNNFWLDQRSLYVGSCSTSFKIFDWNDFDNKPLKTLKAFPLGSEWRIVT